MKKFLLSIAAVAMAFAATATDYKGQLAVSVTDSESGELILDVKQETSIALVKNDDGTYNFSLNNFMLGEGDDAIPVGNIALENQTATEAYGFNTINYKDNVTIAAGDVEGIEESEWVGPLLNEVPIDLTAKFNDTALSVNITITLAIMPQGIQVGFIGVNPDAAPQPQGNKYDVNGDNAVDVGDVNAVLEYILNPTE